MLRFLIADDHAILRRGIKAVLTDTFTDSVIEEVENGNDLIKKVRETDYDIVLSDLSMPEVNGIEALVEIKKIKPKLPVLILSLMPEEKFAMQALRAGASGYLNKNGFLEEIVKAIETVLAGKKYITPTVAEQMARALEKNDDRLLHERLSKQEMSILKLLAEGKSSTAIAKQLNLSVSTVSTYRRRILTKMNMKSNAELVLYMSENKP